MSTNRPPANPYMQDLLDLLCPEQGGKAQALEAAKYLGVHVTTLYDWIRDGMGGARAEHLVKVAAVFHDHGRPLSPEQMGELTTTAQPTTATVG